MIAAMRSPRALLKAAEDPPTVEVEGRAVPVAVRINPRARRLTLRMAPGAAPDGGDGVALTLPPGVDLAEGLAFVERSRGWIAARLDRLPAAVPFADGAQIPILGDAHLIKHADWSRRPAWAEHGILWVGGAAEHLPRRVTDHLIATARREIAARARAKAERLPDLLDGGDPSARHVAEARRSSLGDLFDRTFGGPAAREIREEALRSVSAPRPLGRITLRDTRSRWGSCSHRGDLNFSWRLVFAPLPVLDYVVAHEVAHLAHLDHSPAFWRLCDALSEEPGWTKAWLRRHGQALLRYGARP